MSPALYEAIRHDADKLGRDWNEIAEAALNRVFLRSESEPTGRSPIKN